MKKYKVILEGESGTGKIIESELILEAKNERDAYEKLESDDVMETLGFDCITSINLENSNERA